MRISRSAIVRSVRTSPGEETKTRMVFIMFRNDEAPLNSVPETARIHQSAKPVAPQSPTVANLGLSTQENLCPTPSGAVFGCGYVELGDFRAIGYRSLCRPFLWDRLRSA